MSQTVERLINAAVERYVLAMSAIDEQGLRAAFHPSASVIGNFQTAIEWLSVDAYVGEVVGAGLLKFTKYLSLLRIAGEWKVVSKLYHLHP